MTPHWRSILTRCNLIQRLEFLAGGCSSKWGLYTLVYPQPQPDLFGVFNKICQKMLNKYLTEEMLENTKSMMIEMHDNILGILPPLKGLYKSDGNSEK